MYFQWCVLKVGAIVGRLPAVCEDYKTYMYEKAVAAEEERLIALKFELQAKNSKAQTKSPEEHMRQTMSATRAVLEQLNPTDPVDLFVWNVDWLLTGC